jgi:hypothetical protein
MFFGEEMTGAGGATRGSARTTPAGGSASRTSSRAWVSVRRLEYRECPSGSPAPTPTHEAQAEITLARPTRHDPAVEVDGKRLEITIPAGVDTGGGSSSRAAPRRRRPGRRGARAADKRFTRKGDDLERELPLTLEEALLGGGGPGRDPEGPGAPDHPAGTQTGRTFR